MSIKSHFTLFRKPENQISTTDVQSQPNHPNPLPQWLSLFVGVLIQPFFTYFKENGNINDWSEVYSNYYYIIFGIVIATIIFPSVYRSTFDTDRPKFLQIIPIFTAGLGWQTMVDSVIKGVAGSGSSETVVLIQVLFEQMYLHV